jgi:hypothetical protein
MSRAPYIIGEVPRQGVSPGTIQFFSNVKLALDALLGRSQLASKLDQKLNRAMTGQDLVDLGLVSEADIDGLD